MYAFVAWFEVGDAPSVPEAWHENALRELRERTPAGWQEHSWSGRGWRVVARHAHMGRWRWSFATRERELTVLAAGLPIGLEATTPVDLGRSLLDGQDLGADVVPPLAALAVDDAAGQLVVQQDWFGLGQMFRYRRPGVVAFSSHPTVLPATFGDPLMAQEKGWSLYLGNRSFAGSTSPVRGVRLLDPGERVTGTRGPDGRWQLADRVRWSFDDLVAASLEDRPSLDEMASTVADSISRVARSLGWYWPDEVALGLSGGKDSRMLAAALVSQGVPVRFNTNRENPAEGDTALRLSTLLREKRGLDVRHDFYVATQHDKVLEDSVADRARALQRRTDFMFRSSYLNRPVFDPLPDTMGAPSLTGAAGECLSGSWIPKAWQEDPSAATPEAARQVIAAKANGYVPRPVLVPRARKHLRDHVDGVVERASAHDLDATRTITYAFLDARLRRGPTALREIGQVVPLTTPEVFATGLRLTAGQQLERLIHNRVIERLVPEWAEVPFVSFRTGLVEDDIMRIWRGRGAQDLADLLRRPEGPVSGLLDRAAVQDALERAVAGAGGNREDRLLRQFAMTAVADDTFAAVPAPSGATAEPTPSRLGALTARLARRRR
jgi:hypothetical protein